MLVAKRDPFHPDAHDASSSYGTGAGPHMGSTSRFARTITVLQMVGTLLAIPVGIGSAYSMYQANFSAEATCKSLRGNIVRMLDKNVDAGTRHMLVRRDLEAFENTCGTVDPDATAAFKALLAAEKVTAPATTASVPRTEPQPQEVVRKAEPAPAVKPKQPATRAATVATEAPRDRAASDAAWLAAVRGALVNHELRSASAATPTAPAAPPRMLGELHTPPAQPATTPLAAPTLPPPAAIAPVAAPQVDPDHPVPPAVIPEAASEPDAHPRSRFGELVAEIPFVGKTIADHVSR